MSLEKIKTPGELSLIRDEMAAKGCRLVFTNGCFDLLHAGHVRYLQAARRLGDALAVGLNNDASVRALKGESRPVNTEHDRAEVLAALGCVDFVAIIPEVRMTNAILEIRPQVYAKGGDYTVESLDREEFDALQKTAAEIKILPLVPGRSTTGTLQKLNAANSLSGR
jgi:rfaE bifunctional protein nucleotidyltransferase chain/domain